MSVSNPTVAEEFAYAERTTSYVAPSTAQVTIPGLSITVVIGATPIMVEFWSPAVANDTAGGVTIVQMREDGVDITNGAIFPYSPVATTGAAGAYIHLRRSIAGTHTYTVSLTTFGGIPSVAPNMFLRATRIA